MISSETKIIQQTPVFILAGGLGTRISEETHLKPKPMIEIGGIPILLHIMKSYHTFGFNDFVICAGYRSWEIKEYFLNYKNRVSNIEIDCRGDHKNPSMTLGMHENQERWRVKVIETGLDTMTGARIAKAFDEVCRQEDFENFAVTYGDGVCDVNMRDQFNFHLKHKRIGTVLGVPPPSRFGELDSDDSGLVTGFIEKPENKSGLINGGFFFFKKSFRNYLDTEASLILERRPLMRLTEDRELLAYPHRGFWHAMDTLRDKNFLQNIWDKGEIPWAPQSLAKKYG